MGFCASLVWMAINLAVIFSRSPDHASVLAWVIVAISWKFGKSSAHFSISSKYAAAEGVLLLQISDIFSLDFFSKASLIMLLKVVMPMPPAIKTALRLASEWS